MSSTHTHFVNQLSRHATLKLDVAYERARLKLGLVSDDTDLKRAQARMKAEEPLYPKTIVIRGSVCGVTGEATPGSSLLRYWEGQRKIELTAGCTLAQAMEQALKALNQARREVDPDQEDYAGRFLPGWVLVLDQFGSPVQEYAFRAIEGGESWLEEHPGPRDCQMLEMEVSDLLAESGVEKERGHVSVAETLKRQAEVILNAVKIAKAQSRILH